ncbi:hypothetical protein G9F73_012715 [Clostridium estertheticum]|uniref:hypothetical protein n=1 Tax=Clostridium estertheticum TaxID=238834 RepID=UPI0013EE4159|nr:hypothetical protein [Clostridium estertheticum]MBZ9608671.1 hypothetical protein [Clostridium estertheticum]
MKSEVIAYLTSTINGYERKINKTKCEVAEAQILKNIVEDLGGLYDYVMDFKEVKEDVQAKEKLAQVIEHNYQLSFNNNELIEDITQLRTENSRMCENNNDLRITLEQTEADLLQMEQFRNNYRDLYTEIKTDNKFWQKAYNNLKVTNEQLKAEIATLKAPKWME